MSQEQKYYCIPGVTTIYGVGRTEEEAQDNCKARHDFVGTPLECTESVYLKCTVQDEWVFETTDIEPINIRA